GSGAERDAHVFAAALALAVREGRPHRQGERPALRCAGEPQQQRPYHAHKGDIDGSWVTRQARKGRCMSRFTRYNADGDRPARLDGDAPEHQTADAFDRRTYVISLAGRYASRGNDDIMTVGGARYGGL